MLEDAHHEHPLVAGDDVFGAVAMVHIEVDDGDALEAAHVERMAGCDGDVVEEAEAHRLVAGRVVAGRPHRAEGVLDGAVDDRVGRRHRCAGGAHGGRPGARRGHRVGVEGARAAARGDAFEQIAKLADVAALVGAAEVFHGHHRRLAALERVGQPRGDQVVVDGVEPLRTLGMAVAHVVTTAVGMAVEGRRHETRERCPLCRERRERRGVIF